MGDSQRAELVAWIKSLGWRVDDKRNGYPLAFCPCKKHKKTIHKTPSDPNYFLNLRKWFERQPCVKEREDQS